MIENFSTVQHEKVYNTEEEQEESSGRNRSHDVTRDKEDLD